MQIETPSTDLFAVTALSYDPSLLADIEAYENENVIYRFQCKLSLEREAAEQLFQDTKRFLFICACFADKGPFSPTAAIDDGWHEFLMFTEDYQEFCLRHFGKFLHHRPFVRGHVQQPGGVYRAYTLARRLFDSDLSSNWMVTESALGPIEVQSNCSCGGSCGGGCNG